MAIGVVAATRPGQARQAKPVRPFQKRLGRNEAASSPRQCFLEIRQAPVRGTGTRPPQLQCGAAGRRGFRAEEFDHRLPCRNLPGIPATTGTPRGASFPGSLCCTSCHSCRLGRAGSTAGFAPRARIADRPTGGLMRKILRCNLRGTSAGVSSFRVPQFSRVPGGSAHNGY